MGKTFVHVQGCSRFPCFASAPQGGLMERVSDSCSSDEISACPQMGTAEEVRAAEQVNITLSCAKGMKMHAIPRVAPVKTTSEKAVA